MPTYLYGIVRWPVPWGRSGKSRRAKERAGADADADPLGADPLGAGVGDPPKRVELLPHRDLAAVVSNVATGEVGGADVRALRQDMKAHSGVLNRLVELGAPSLLPVRFGVVLPTPEALAGRLLEPQYPLLLDYLDRLQGAAEVSLKVTYVEERVLAEVVAEQPRILRRAGSVPRGRPGPEQYQSKIEIGRQVAAALRERQARDGKRLLDALRPVVRDARAGKPASDLTVLNASFLVEKSGLPEFDKALEKLNAEVGHLMRFDCVGPLPPYSFAELRL
jgi:hypothetical protein